MGGEHAIVQMVYRAKKDALAADELISQYMNFIRSETARHTHALSSEGRDDALSIAMFAFYEAVQGYQRGRGSFLSYASAAIRNRLVDYHRKEERHQGTVSYDAPSGDGEEQPLSDRIPSGEDGMKQWTVREATKEELEEFASNLMEYGLSLSEVADNCPKQERTLAACHRALQAAREHPGILERFVKNRRLPLAELTAVSGVARKTLERHHSYMMAILLAYTNGYEIIRGHLCQISRGKEASI